jgi:hypothetical protein
VSAEAKVIPVRISSILSPPAAGQVESIQSPLQPPRHPPAPF